MAQSTTIINAKDVHISVNAQDIGGSSKSISIPIAVQNAKFHTADGDWAVALAGKYEVGTGTLEVYYSETDNEAENVLKTAFYNRTAVAFLTSPKGNNTGDKTWAFNAIITGLPLTFDAGTPDPIMISAPFEVSGAITEGTAS